MILVILCRLRLALYRERETPCTLLDSLLLIQPLT